MSQSLSSARPSRKAKQAHVDYAVLGSGQLIPEYSSEECSSSSDENYSSNRKKKQKQKQKRLKRKSSNTQKINLHAATSQMNQCKDYNEITKKEQCLFYANCQKDFHLHCKTTKNQTNPLTASPKIASSQESLFPKCQEHDMKCPEPMLHPKVGNLKDFLHVLKNAKNIVVLAGAGISVSCGIPDFRSKNGVYELVKHMNMQLPEPECLFHIDYFRQDPTLFFTMVRNLFSDSPDPSSTHYFLKWLQEKNQLLRIYTQNIDGLEYKAGIEASKIINCHGSFHTSTCMRCRHQILTETIFPIILAGDIPTCTHEIGSKYAFCNGIYKPDVTFFGEKVSDTIGNTIVQDRLKADLLLIIGTSLQVAPVAEIPEYFPSNIPKIVINKTQLVHYGTNQPFEMTFLGDCDVIFNEIQKAMQDIDGKINELQENIHYHKIAQESAIACFNTCAYQILQPETIDIIDNIICNGCNEEITSQDRSYHCNNCFDFDYCTKCYDTKLDQHYQGNHTFIPS